MHLRKRRLILFEDTARLVINFRLRRIHDETSSSYFVLASRYPGSAKAAANLLLKMLLLRKL